MPEDAARPNLKLSIVTGWNFTRAYGTLGHLGAALVARGIDVEMVGRVPSASLGELDTLPFPARSWYARWYGRIPKLRYFFADREIASWLERRGGAILNTDLHFFNVATGLKRSDPARPWIQMCYELQLPEEYPRERNVALSMRRTVEPDLWIDVEPNRARVRAERLGIPMPLILPNTLPSGAIPLASPPGALAKLAGTNLPSDRPILLYVGSASIGRSLPRVVEALRGAKRRPFFLAFVHGNPSETNRIASELEVGLGQDNARVCPPVPRNELLAAMREASAGLVYYPHSDEPTLNHLYCARLRRRTNTSGPGCPSSPPPTRA